MHSAQDSIDASSNPYLWIQDYYLNCRKAEIEVLQGKDASLDIPAISAPAAEPALLS